MQSRHPWAGTMPRIPLEDNLEDVLRKAQRGLHLTDEEVARRAEVSPAEMAALKEGEINDAVLRRVARHLQLGPNALGDLARKRWYPEQPLFPRGFLMFNTPFGEMSVNSYLVWDSRTLQAAAFDTGATAEPMLVEIRTAGLQVRDIFITHTHEDHIADLARLAAETGAQVWSSELESVRLSGAKTFRDAAHFHVGSLEIKALLTPGHSPGQVTYYVTGLSYPLAIVGDSLFASSTGGSDQHFREQLQANRSRIFTLPRDTVLAPGHGPLTTLAQEKAHNPFYAR
jgi:hydroxyacylglutathione hydrolase